MCTLYFLLRKKYSAKEFSSLKRNKNYFDYISRLRIKIITMISIIYTINIIKIITVIKLISWRANI